MCAEGIGGRRIAECKRSEQMCNCSPAASARQLFEKIDSGKIAEIKDLAGRVSSKWLFPLRLSLKVVRILELGARFRSFAPIMGRAVPECGAMADKHGTRKHR
jgi:hypothetical protein